MNKITFLLLCIALLWGCSTNHNIDSTIKDIYGSNVPSKEEDGAYIYVLNYKWETPSIRVVLISRKCIDNNGRDITIIITNKG